MSLGTDLRVARVASLMQPRSIAVLGASDRPGVGQRVLANLRAMDFAGDLWLVNPNRAEVAGSPTVPSVADLPAAADLVIAAVNREATVLGLAQAADRGCQASVVLAAGFAESDERGRELDDQLRGLAGAMPIMGPNCLGYVNLVEGVAAYSGPLMEPPEPGVVALVSQSGALACTFTGAAAERGIRFSHVITTGNSLDLGLTDYVRYLATDQSVRVIACYVEGFRDGRDLLEAMEGAMRSGKTVVVLKAGRSALGGVAARTHTGTLAGSARIQTSLWEDRGVLVAEDIEEFLSLIELCSRSEITPGARVAILTISGGERLLMADLADELNLPLAEFDPSTVEELRGVLPAYATVANPLDTTGAGVVDGDTGVHRAAAAIVSCDAGVDVLVACQDAKNGWTQADRSSTLFRDCVLAALEAANDAGKQLVVLSPSTGEMDEPTRLLLQRHGAPFLSGLRAGSSALAKVLGAEQAPRALAAAPRPGTRESFASDTRVALSGLAALTYLATHGVPTWPTGGATAEDEAVEMAEEFGYPVAMKIDGPAIQHRSDVGGVRVGLTSRADIRTAWRDLHEAAARANLPVETILVQPMAAQGVDVFVGGLRDDQFGPVVLCGPGGVLLELIGDAAAALAPMEEQEARRLLRSTRLVRLLEGVRGAAPADLEQLAEVLVAISRVVAMPEVVALDVNPLIALPQAVAIVDAKLVVRTDAHEER